MLKTLTISEYYFFLNLLYIVTPFRHSVRSNAAVFKLGSADQRGSATGSHGVCEKIPKSSNCLHGF